MKSYSGVISKDSLTILDKSKDGCFTLWGDNGKIYFNNKSSLFVYDPLTREKNVVFSPGNFKVSGEWEKLVYAPQKRSIMIFDYTYRSWFSDKIIFGRLVLDVDKQEYVDLILGYGKEI